MGRGSPSAVPAASRISAQIHACARIIPSVPLAASHPRIARDFSAAAKQRAAKETTGDERARASSRAAARHRRQKVRSGFRRARTQRAADRDKWSEMGQRKRERTETRVHASARARLTRTGAHTSRVRQNRVKSTTAEPAKSRGAKSETRCEIDRCAPGGGKYSRFPRRRVDAGGAFCAPRAEETAAFYTRPVIYERIYLMLQRICRFLKIIYAAMTASMRYLRVG